MLASCERSIPLIAPAKLNLGLRIVGRRDDGYHQLESLFWPVTFADEVMMAPADRWRLDTDWTPDAPKRQPLPGSEENLVTKAFSLLDADGKNAWSVRLRKRIPMGAGLGGGSSDAGTILRHFVPAQPQLAARAVELGADVPFFLDPRPAWVSGIGERCERLPVDPQIAAGLFFLLVLLPEPIDTRAAFRQYRALGTGFSPSRPLSTIVPASAPLDLDGLHRYLAEARNDLLPAAEMLCPRVSTVIAALRSAPCRYADLSGSGSTCFAIFDDAVARENTSQALSTFFRENFCISVFAETFRVE